MWSEFRRALILDPVGRERPFHERKQMKLTQFINLLVIASALSLTASGCKKSPVGVTPIPDRSGAHVGDVGPGGTLPGQPGGDGTAGGVPQPSADKYPGPRDEKIFEAYMVHFDYDSPSVRSSEQSKIAYVADYLKSHPDNGLEVQGHCDERGTDQYNFSLGDRRALAVRDELIKAGVGGDRILTVSFGRSRPIDTGHSDAAHSRNRRAQFVLLSK
jgi:peptidoglycan-associated lipoprotein